MPLQFVLHFLTLIVIFAVADYSMPPNIMLLAPRMFGRGREEPDAFYFRFRSRLKLRAVVGLLLATIGALGQSDEVPFEAQVVAVVGPITIYGVVVIRDMLRARPSGP